MISAEIFQTDVVQMAKRVDYWNDVAASTFGDIAVDPLTSEFTASLQRRRIGDLTVAKILSAPARVEGARSDSGRNSADGWFVLLNERGTSRMRQSGREAVLGEGELTALRAGERYEIEFTQPNGVIVLWAPDDGGAIDLDAHCTRRHGSGQAALLSALMRELGELEIADARSAARVERMVFDLAALCWPAKRRPALRDPSALWEQRVRLHVDRNLVDPSLCAASIASCLGVSQRYVQKIFMRSGMTASAYILEARLSRAAERLRADPTARITDVALDSGFSDLSHFCRKFHARFGASARNWRALQ